MPFILYSVFEVLFIFVNQISSLDDWFVSQSHKKTWRKAYEFRFLTLCFEHL